MAGRYGTLLMSTRHVRLIDKCHHQILILLKVVNDVTLWSALREICIEGMDSDWKEVFNWGQIKECFKLIKDKFIFTINP